MKSSDARGRRPMNRSASHKSSNQALATMNTHKMVQNSIVGTTEHSPQNQ